MRTLVGVRDPQNSKFHRRVSDQDLVVALSPRHQRCKAAMDWELSSHLAAVLDGLVRAPWLNIG